MGFSCTVQLPDLLGLACAYATPLAYLLYHCRGLPVLPLLKLGSSQTGIWHPAGCASEDTKGLAKILYWQAWGHATEVRYLPAGV